MRERRHRVVFGALLEGVGEARSAGMLTTGEAWKNRRGVCCAHPLDIERRRIVQLWNRRKGMVGRNRKRRLLRSTIPRVKRVQERTPRRLKRDPRRKGSTSRETSWSSKAEAGRWGCRRVGAESERVREVHDVGQVVVPQDGQGRWGRDGRVRVVGRRCRACPEAGEGVRGAAFVASYSLQVPLAQHPLGAGERGTHNPAPVVGWPWFQNRLGEAAMWYLPPSAWQVGLRDAPRVPGYGPSSSLAAVGFSGKEWSWGHVCSSTTGSRLVEGEISTSSEKNLVTDERPGRVMGWDRSAHAMEQTKERRRLERAKGGVVLHLFSPHLCVGFLFLILYPAPPGPAASSRPRRLLCHTQHCHTLSLSHTTLSYTLFHTQLCHTLSLSHTTWSHHLSHTTLSHTISFTQSFVTHHLSHTTLSYTLFHTTLSRTIFHTKLCHTPSFTHNFVTHHLSHTTLSYFVTHSFTHTPLSRTIFHTQLCHTPSVTHHLSHTTLSHTIFHTHTTLSQTLFPFAWQAWHLATSTCVWRSRRGACCTWLALVACLVAVSRLGRCATLRGRHGTCSHELSFCVAGVALGDIDFRFAW